MENKVIKIDYQIYYYFKRNMDNNHKIDKKEPLEKEPLKKEPLEKEPLEKEPLEKEPLKKEPLEKEPLKKEPLKKISKSAQKALDDFKKGKCHTRK